MIQVFDFRMVFYVYLAIRNQFVLLWSIFEPMGTNFLKLYVNNHDVICINYMPPSQAINVLLKSRFFLLLTQSREKKISNFL